MTRSPPSPPTFATAGARLRRLYPPMTSPSKERNLHTGPTDRRSQSANRLRAGFRPLMAMIALASMMPAGSLARVTPADYREVGASVPPNAHLPLDATVTDSSGAQQSLRDIISRPTVLVFADYKCRTLCGPVVSFVASALERSGLSADGQFELLVVGLDPKDVAADASDMRRRHIDAGSPLFEASNFVTADQPTVKALTAAVGYSYYYDTDDTVFIHPAAAYVLTSNGGVSRVLTGLGLSA